MIPDELKRSWNSGLRHLGGILSECLRYVVREGRDDGSFCCTRSERDVMHGELFDGKVSWWPTVPSLYRQLVGALVTAVHERLVSHAKTGVW